MPNIHRLALPSLRPCRISKIEKICGKGRGDAPLNFAVQKVGGGGWRFNKVGALTINNTYTIPLYVEQIFAYNMIYVKYVNYLRTKRTKLTNY